MAAAPGGRAGTGRGLLDCWDDVFGCDKEVDVVDVDDRSSPFNILVVRFLVTLTWGTGSSSSCSSPTDVGELDRDECDELDCDAGVSRPEFSEPDAWESRSAGFDSWPEVSNANVGGFSCDEACADAEV